MNTATPSAANRSATARPMPLELPVTTAVLFCFDITSPLTLGCLACSLGVHDGSYAQSKRKVQCLFNYLLIKVLNLVVARCSDFSYYVVVRRKSSASDQISTEQRAKVFKALSDPTRLRMVKMLSDRKQMCGTEIAENLGISLALLCHHWKTLEHAGLVVKTKEGQTASVSLNRQLLSDCFSDVID